MASTDLKITRTRAIRLDESSGAVIAPDGSGNPLELILGMLRRQWPLLIVAGLISGTVAWFVSLEYATSTVTVEMELKSQPLPVTNHSIYTAPNPEVAAALLMSESVLQPIVEKHGLPPVRYFLRQLTVTPNVRSGTIDVTLLHTENNSATLILNDLGAEFVQAISRHRRDLLTEHASHVSSLLLQADRDLSQARSEFIKLKDSLQLKDADLRQNVELQGLVDRRIQVETEIEQRSRGLVKIQRRLQILASDSVAVQNDICSAVLKSRQRQAESLGKGLTKAARIANVKMEILAQLTSLEQELNASMSDSGSVREGRDDLVNGHSAESDVIQPSAAKSDPSVKASGGAVVRAGGLTKSQVGDPPVAGGDSRTEISPDTEDVVTQWTEKVAAVGKEALGDLDPQTANAIQFAREKLANFDSAIRQTKFDLDDNNQELEYFEVKGRDLQTALDGATTKLLSGTSARAMELESDLNRKEQSYSALAAQLHQIQQIKDCKLSEYAMHRSAGFVPEAEKSDRKKLFVFAFLGSGLFLLIPSAIFELVRSRPSPINVVSRRWNLPILGVQSSNGRRKTGALELAASSQHEFRLMALRIQQSLFRPNGRVVLFSGLDHDESPMALIRSLAKCFSQREESVLIIQTVSSQLAANGTKIDDKHSQFTGRPGVAEILAGKCADPAELVLGTGFAGVGFLPGGHGAGASEAMASSRLTALVEGFRETYSMILLCGPSTLHPADLQMLAARADGIVFTVNKQSLHTVYGNEVIGDLIELGGPILGFAEQPSLARKAFPGDAFHPELEAIGESSTEPAFTKT